MSFFFCQTAQGERLRFGPFCSPPNRVTADSAVKRDRDACSQLCIKVEKTRQNISASWAPWTGLTESDIPLSTARQRLADGLFKKPVKPQQGISQFELWFFRTADFKIFQFLLTFLVFSRRFIKERLNLNGSVR